MSPSSYPTPLSVEHHHPSLRLDESTVEEIIKHVIAAEEATLVHLSVVLTDHKTVRQLNRSYLDHDYNTDVLSFSLQNEPSADPSVVEGEIYVDLDTAQERYDEFDTTFEREACRYIIHGVLHLLGYDDATDAEQTLMREKEDAYLADVPYS